MRMDQWTLLDNIASGVGMSDHRFLQLCDDQWERELIFVQEALRDHMQVKWTPLSRPKKCLP